MYSIKEKYLRRMEPHTKEVAASVKELVLQYDTTATVVLFGSRARGDAAAESDWDFLILTKEADTEKLASKLRTEIRRKVESQWNIAISLIVKNRQVWEEDYAVTNIYESIAEEGLAI